MKYCECGHLGSFHHGTNAYGEGYACALCATQRPSKKCEEFKPVK